MTDIVIFLDGRPATKENVALQMKAKQWGAIAKVGKTVPTQVERWSSLAKDGHHTLVGHVDTARSWVSKGGA